MSASTVSELLDQVSMFRECELSHALEEEIVCLMFEGGPSDRRGDVF